MDVRKKRKMPKRIPASILYIPIRCCSTDRVAILFLFYHVTSSTDRQPLLFLHTEFLMLFMNGRSSSQSFYFFYLLLLPDPFDDDYKNRNSGRGVRVKESKAGSPAVHSR